jgi:double stranded RNA-specific editase B
VTQNDVLAQKRKVLAGIVMTREDQPMRVLCVTTGTKCVSGGNLSLMGDVVQDCHAEVIAKRCLQLFLLREMTKAPGEFTFFGYSEL